MYVGGYTRQRENIPSLYGNKKPLQIAEAKHVTNSLGVSKLLPMGIAPGPGVGFSRDSAGFNTQWAETTALSVYFPSAFDRIRGI